MDILLNHDKKRKLGSTSEGTLSLYEDNIGLRASADISDAEVVEEARAGKLRGWSFGFRKLASEIENRSNAVPRRIVTSMALSEVSLIDDRYTPCYAGTSIELRADGETDEFEVRSNEEEVKVTEIPEERSEDTEVKPEVHNEWCEPYLKWLEIM